MNWYKRHRLLRECVSDVRVWLEILSLPRSSRADSLFRSLDEGPYSLLQWSHRHPPSTRFNLVVVAMESD
jgi:hypothetical protein